MCPRRNFELIFECARLAGIANQIAAEPTGNAFDRLPLVPVGRVGLRIAGTSNVAQENQHQKCRRYYAHVFFAAEIAEKAILLDIFKVVRDTCSRFAQTTPRKNN